MHGIGHGAPDPLDCTDCVGPCPEVSDLTQILQRVTLFLKWIITRAVTYQSDACCLKLDLLVSAHRGDQSALTDHRATGGD